MKKNGGTDFLVGIFRRPWDMSGRLKMYSGLTLNQYGVASSCRTICTVCGFVALS
ncbi:hypothetical protein HMPREF9418_0739 [Neisseria macacae ATCC 33926]|uniref:Uncharacterized protein n=1 Tax=Neisseria macacae ATCC 33926 TaxID=997348 RepID=A0AA36UKM9_9NEIS|nr:hypothetical protein HMPREF9418_0739 [Neisseria macacae ATCC 33926]